MVTERARRSDADDSRDKIRSKVPLTRLALLGVQHQHMPWQASLVQ